LGKIGNNFFEQEIFWKQLNQKTKIG